MPWLPLGSVTNTVMLGFFSSRGREVERDVLPVVDLAGLQRGAGGGRSGM